MILCGIIIGLLLGMPVGAIGMMMIQRAFKYGFKAGLLTGFGSSVADCIYACSGTFGFTFISDFFIKYKVIINIFGGLLIILMGIKAILSNNEVIKQHNHLYSGVGMFLSSFIMGITNPAAILTFMFTFSYFGISGNVGIFSGVLLICGVFIGTYIWWIFLSAIVSVSKKKIKYINFYKINRTLGVILVLFGFGIFLKIIIWK